MESLVEKWKTTLNTKKLGTVRESQSMLKNSLQASNEKPPIKPNGGLPSSIRKPLKRESSSSSDDELSMELFKNPPRNKITKADSTNNSARKQTTEKQTENTPKRTEGGKDFIKEQVYLILDLFEQEIPLKGQKVF